jgi:hypothetical protein
LVSYLLAALATAFSAASVVASSSHSGNSRPYAIEEICDADGYGCTAHMRYAPGQNMAGNPARNYWYATPRHYVHYTHHFRLCLSKHKKRRRP